jgi:hypothetical protein
MAQAQKIIYTIQGAISSAFPIYIMSTLICCENHQHSSSSLSYSSESSSDYHDLPRPIRTMANIGGANGVGQDPLKDLTVFPEGCSSKSGGLLCPPQIHTIYPFYRNAELSEPTDEQLCDMEVLTPGRELQFVTTTPASSLLRACKTSREVILKTHSGCIESAHRKIRFNKDHDVILMYTPEKCCWAFPGIYPFQKRFPTFARSLRMCNTLR